MDNKSSIDIINLKDELPTHPYDFHIDRRVPVGNPYLLKNEEDRDLVCDYYEEHFYRMIFYGNIEFRNYLYMLKDVYEQYGKLRLFCWCAPKRCHGDVIKQFILDDEAFKKKAKVNNLKSTPF